MSELAPDEVKLFKERLIALQARIFESSAKVAVEINSLLFDLGMVYERRAREARLDEPAVPTVRNRFGVKE